VYEHDLTSNQFRNGGDIKGLMDSLDYLQGMGIQVSENTSKGG
jgi:alpha-1,3-glucan synthase